MATKKSSRKKQKNTSPRNIILVLIAAVFGALTIWMFVSIDRQQKLEREDREKFTVLEAKMGDVKSKFEQITPGISWEQINSCSRMSTTFPTNEGVGCSIEIIAMDGVDSAQVDRLRSELTELGFDRGEMIASSEDEETFITDYNPRLNDAYCSLVVTDAGRNDESMKPMFYCRAASSTIIYPIQ